MLFLRLNEAWSGRGRGLAGGSDWAFFDVVSVFVLELLPVGDMDVKMVSAWGSSSVSPDDVDNVPG